MKFLRPILLPLLAVACLTTAWGAQRPFSDYQIILNRKPFGDFSAAMAASDQPQEQRMVPIHESFAATLRLSGLFELSDGTPRAAIIDKKDNSYFAIRLDEPDSPTGISLLEVSFESREAIIQKGDEVVVLSMDDDGSKVLTAEEGTQRVQEAQTKRLSYRERREQRQLARARAMEEQAKRPRLTGAELEEHLQNYQMEVLRTGLPPLPVQLTPDRDAQLVQEGILPPQDESGYELEDLEYEQPAGYDEYGPYYL